MEHNWNGVLVWMGPDTGFGLGYQICDKESNNQHKD